MYQLYLCFAAIFLFSCNENQEEFKNPVGYDLGKPEKFIMPDALNEISGISFNNDSLYAIQDEEGKLFYLRPGDKKAGSAQFGKKGDYEDLAIINGQVIILRSDGTLFSFAAADASAAKEWQDLVPKGEYEGLYADAADSKIYVLCKQCKKDVANLHILQLQPDGSMAQSGSASINEKDIEKLSGEKKLNFHPSALAKNPRTQEWYIVSSANKMLVIADNSWKIKETYPLPPAHFRQPEGIAFDRENNLYISNEGDAVSNGNVLKFDYNNQN